MRSCRHVLLLLPLDAKPPVPSNHCVTKALIAFTRVGALLTEHAPWTFASFEVEPAVTLLLEVSKAHGFFRDLRSRWGWTRSAGWLEVSAAKRTFIDKDSRVISGICVVRNGECDGVCS